jgi:hypothetical protein
MGVMVWKVRLALIPKEVKPARDRGRFAEIIFSAWTHQGISEPK